MRTIFKCTRILLGGILLVGLTAGCGGKYNVDTEVKAYVDSTLNAALHYDPGCSIDDRACTTWIKFRKHRPYPYQTIAGIPFEDGTGVIVISEPAPQMEPEEFIDLVQATFGDDLIELWTGRWPIGIDGWVEDIILEIKWPRISYPETAEMGELDYLADPVLRDRIAFLHQVLHVTTFGGNLEDLSLMANSLEKPSTVNLKVNAHELNSWVSEPDLKWSGIDQEDDDPLSWSRIAKEHRLGTYESSDHSLIMFTFPTDWLLSMETAGKSIQSIRAAFRHFAIISDVILGGMWSADDGQAAIIARSRIEPLSVFPPLRFETFLQLLTEASEDLAQSYERNKIFAGKMYDGEHFFKDWAPIYLSESLIDTEFGALLNITDQMLKSWSQAGQVEYIYFQYPLKPTTYAFGNRPLYDILKEKTGTTQVLFNWNTSGFGAVVELAELSFLTPEQTGALPVTYGSELNAGGTIETGHLFEYEEKAFDYFANLEDPNLGRVVQYTLLFQLLRAIKTDMNHVSSHSTTDESIESRSAATDSLVSTTFSLLNIPNQDLDVLLFDFRLKYPDITNQQLAEFLVDPQLAMAYMIDTQIALLDVSPDELEAKQQAFDSDAKQYILDFDAFKNSLNLSTLTLGANKKQMELEALRKDLELRGNDLGKRSREIDELVTQYYAIQEQAASLFSDISELRRLLNATVLVRYLSHLIQENYILNNAAEPKRWIKTPSVVLSWNRENIFELTGGHNLNSRALRMVPSKNVSRIDLVDTPSGLVLKYNPNLSSKIASKSTKLSRAVEHLGVRDAGKLNKIISDPAVIRPRFTALKLSPKGSTLAKVTRPAGKDIWSGRLGTRLYKERHVFVNDLRKMAENNRQFTFVAKDQMNISYIAKTSTKPGSKSTIIEVRDTPSLRDYLAKAGKGSDADKSIIFLDMPQSQVEALTIPSGPGQNASFARLLGSARTKSSSSKVTSIIHRGANGNYSEIRVSKPGGGGGKSIRNHLPNAIKRNQPWQNAEVSELNATRTMDLINNAGWQVRPDGIPFAVEVKLGVTGVQGSSKTMTILTLFKKNIAVNGRAQVTSKVKTIIKQAVENNENMPGYMRRLQNELQKLNDIELRHLRIIVKDQMGTLHFGDLESAGTVQKYS